MFVKSIIWISSDDLRGLDVALCSAAVSACRSPGSWPQAHQLLTETRQLRVVWGVPSGEGRER